MARHLSGFSGILQVDGYSAYSNLAKARAKTGSNETIQLAGCWAHLRRKFYDLHISGVSQTATDTIVAMTELWKVEDEVRGKDAAPEPAAVRKRPRSSSPASSSCGKRSWVRSRENPKLLRRSATRSRGVRPSNAS